MTTQWPAASVRTSSARLVVHAAVLFLFIAGLFAAIAWRGRIDVPPPVATPTAEVTAESLARAEHASVEARDRRADAYRRLGEYLAARYRTSPVVATDIVSKAHAVGRRLELDPALILAVISVESRFNPIAESAMGAKGLMQVIPRFHADKIASVGGEYRMFELEPNITVGARILKEYMRNTGDLFDALQMYVGASSEEDANEYSEKVARERGRLDYILRRRHPAT
jgi:soluble lytic murein transglycosylase-like protein